MKNKKYFHCVIPGIYQLNGTQRIYLEQLEN